ncbi:hypothetical protein AC629_03450 [Bradyrhizobium sp. NAS80.1]|nr:hypothetical protein AC629_03450 [Bradyrhizobium sp. NAS80.1]
MELFWVPANEENLLTFIKLRAHQSARDCCIWATDSTPSLGYDRLGIEFIWASRLISRFGDLKKRTKLGRLQ